MASSYSLEELSSPTPPVTSNKDTGKTSYSLEELTGAETSDTHAFGRAAVEAIPTGLVGIAGFGAGMKVAAPLAVAAGSVSGPAAPLVAGAVALTGGLVGSFAASGGAAWVQDKLHAIIAPDDYKARQQEKKAYPKATMAGNIAGGLAGLSPKTVPEVAGQLLSKPIVQRGVSAGMNAGIDAAEQLITKGNIDLTQLGLTTAAGAAMPGFNVAGKAAFGAGEKAAGAFKGKPKGEVPPDADKPVVPPSEQPKVTPEEEAAFIQQMQKAKEEKQAKKLTQAAFRDPKTGDILPVGRNHPEEMKAEHPEWEQGFLSNDNTFHNRTESVEIAKRTGQIPEDATLTSPEEGLRSADLRNAGVERFALPKEPTKDVPSGDKPKTSEEAWKKKHLELHEAVSIAEKYSDPDTWTKAEREAWDSGDWKEFSKLRGYTEEEIKTYQKYLDSVDEGVTKHGWPEEDVQSLEFFGDSEVGSTKKTNPEPTKTITTLKDGSKISITPEKAPRDAFSTIVRSQYGEPLTLTAKNESGEIIGRLDYMLEGGPIDVFVAEGQRRKGVATALYDALEAAGGKVPLKSSGFALSKAAEAFRSARNKRQSAPQKTEPLTRDDFKSRIAEIDDTLSGKTKSDKTPKDLMAEKAALENNMPAAVIKNKEAPTLAELKDVLWKASTFGDVIDTLAPLKLGNKGQQMLLNLLGHSKLAREAGFEFTSNKLKFDERAHYHPDDDVIRIRPEDTPDDVGGVRLETVLHEGLHAATYDMLHYDLPFTQKLQALLDFVRIEAKNQGYGKLYPLKDVHELVAYANTNDSFVTFLNTVKLPANWNKVGDPPTTGWQTFKNAVVEALGKRIGVDFTKAPKEVHTALDEALNLTSHVVTAKDRPGKGLNFEHNVHMPKEIVSSKVLPEEVKKAAKDIDVRKIADEAQFTKLAEYIYETEGAAPSIDFLKRWKTFKETWGDAIKEVENGVGININNKMANERIVHNKSEDIKTLVPSKLERENISVAIDQGKTSELSGKSREAADIYNAEMKRIGESAIKHGVVKGLLEDYVSHIINWSEMPKGALTEFLDNVLGVSPKGEGKGMSPETRFAKERHLKTFQDVTKVLADINDRIAKAGKSDFRLEIKTLDIAEIYKQYGLSMEKAIENKKLIDHVMTVRNVAGETMVRRVTEAEPMPRDWVMIDNRQFAGMAVHPDIAPALRFAFDSKGSAVINALYKTSQAIKRINVIASFFHAKSLMEVLSSTGIPLWTPIKEVSLGGVDKLLGTKYSGITKALDQFRKGGVGDSADKWIKSGLVLEMPDDVSKGLFSAAGKVLDEAIGKYGPKTRILESSLGLVERKTLGIVDKFTWDFLHTGGKLYTAEKYLQRAEIDAAKQGKPFDEAKSRDEISKFINNSFGGLNWFQAAKDAQTKFGKQMAMAAFSPAGRKGMQTMLFAPDWTISTIRAFTAALPKGMNPTKWHPIEGIKGMRNPETQADYARLYQVKTALVYFTLLNAINMMTANRPIWENKDPTRIEWPDGTSMQAMKHAMEPYHWLADPVNTLTNKLGFLPKSAIIAVTGSEYPSPYAPKMVDPSMANRAKAIASQAIPFQVSAAISAPEGEGLKRAAFGTLGVPMYGTTKQQKKEVRKERTKAQREQSKKYHERERAAGRE